MAREASGGMRALKIATVAMGVLIVLGTTVILITIVKRTMSGPAASGSRAVSEKPFATTLDEPPGTGIAGIASVRDRLAIQLHGGGADRVVLLDPDSGAVVGRVELSR